MTVEDLQKAAELVEELQDGIDHMEAALKGLNESLENYRQFLLAQIRANREAANADAEGMVK